MNAHPIPGRRPHGLGLAVLLLLAGPALAAGGGGGGGGATPGRADLTHELMAAQQRIDRQDWPGAIKELEQAARKDDGNADVHNLLGYSLRKSGQVDKALAQYRIALRIDPKHLGAHEYMGEAWLMVNRPDKAREHLLALSGLCGTRCEQYEDLAKAVAAYDAGPPATRTAGR